MTSDRWQQVDRLYHGALEQPAAERAAFLAEACAGDADLQREVQSLLDQASMPGFLEEPALALAAAVAGRPDVSWVGRSIGVYHVQAFLGRGGMGEVYRAHDTRLGRDVALKVLPPGFSLDPDRLARFGREARLLASLNHPNIGAIHGFEEAGSASGPEPPVRALVLELVDGDTLADRIARGPLPIPDALLIARQIADALEAAHDKGIVHRDLKPANIKITPDHVVKVLDFGLAKTDTPALTGNLEDSPTGTASATEAGLILGTAPYMSPEQARGQAVDKRTDVWAFGCVVYEMLTGRLAFPGATMSDTMAAILRNEPDWTALPPALPPGVVTLLHRCLEKDPRRRKRDVGDARAELDEALTKPVARAATLGAAHPPEARRRGRWAWAVALIGIVGAVAGFWPRAWQDPLASATFSHVTHVTTFPGTEADAVISPDGRLAAFLSDRAGQFDVYVTQLGTNVFQNLTLHDEVDARQNIGSARDIGFTGDGSEIWLGGSPPGSPSKRLMQKFSILGEDRRRFLPADAMNVAWAPDGKRIVYYTGDVGDSLWVAEPGGANPDRIFNGGPGGHNHAPVWSSDGQWIYFTRSAPANVQGVWRIRPSGTGAEALTQHRVEVSSLTPIDARSLMYIARDGEGAGPWLWWLDLKTRISHKVNSGLDHYTSLSASADGRRLVASVASPQAVLWSAPIGDGVAGPAEVAPLRDFPSIRALAPRVRGAALYYLSAQGAGDGLWKYLDGQTTEIWRGSQGALLAPAAISPDGLSVAVLLMRGGRQTLMILAADGTDPRNVGESIDVFNGPVDWSPDGNWIVAGGRGTGGDGLYKIPVAGGDPQRIKEGLAQAPVWSPAGDLIAYKGASVRGNAVVLAVQPDGTPVALPNLQVAGRTNGSLRFVPGGRGIVILRGGVRARDFWLLDLDSKQVRQLTDIATQTDLGDIESFDVTSDGRIIFDRIKENSDIRLIELPAR
jgi:Tol biopolymer transport system component